MLYNGIWRLTKGNWLPNTTRSHMCDMVGRDQDTWSDESQFTPEGLAQCLAYSSTQQRRH